MMGGSKGEDALSQSVHRNATLCAIHDRHSVRWFTDQEVSEADVIAILDAANRAPSAHNQQSWRFTVLREAKKHALGELVTTKAGDFPRPASILLRMASRSILSAPVVVAISNTGDLIRHGSELFEVEGAMAYDFFRTMEIQSSAAAAENLLIAATSLGLGSVWLGILFLIKDDVLRFLDEPEGEFMAVIPVGYPAKKSEGPRKRPLETIVRYATM
jgi:nitroreductase